MINTFILSFKHLLKFVFRKLCIIL